MTNQLRSNLLEHIAQEAVSERVDLWPGVRGRVEAARARRRGAWLGVAAAAAVSTALGVALLPGLGGNQSVSAQTILDRAQTVASGASISTYHLLMTRQEFAKGGGTSLSEVWFGGPDHQRTQERDLDSSGSIVQQQDVIFSGPDAWIVITQAGQTQAIHTIGTNWTKPADNPSTQGGLADILSSYGAKDCMAARLEKGDGVVAGRATYAIEVAENPAGCGPLLSVSAAASPAASPVPHVSGELGQTRVNGPQPVVRVQVDKQSFLPLATEVRDAIGTVLQRSEVTQVEYNVSIPDTTFTYVAPAGVVVRTFQGGDGAEVKRALNGVPGQNPQK